MKRVICHKQLPNAISPAPCQEYAGLEERAVQALTPAYIKYWSEPNCYSVDSPANNSTRLVKG
jgi:hypothetical protein